jgi:hypothetical protein
MFYVSVGGVRKGPMPESVLRRALQQKKIGPDTFAWTDGQDSWKPVLDALDRPKIAETPQDDSTAALRPEGGAAAATSVEPNSGRPIESFSMRDLATFGFGVLAVSAILGVWFPKVSVVTGAILVARCVVLAITGGRGRATKVGGASLCLAAYALFAVLEIGRARHSAVAVSESDGTSDIGQGGPGFGKSERELTEGADVKPISDSGSWMFSKGGMGMVDLCCSEKDVESMYITAGFVNDPDKLFEMNTNLQTILTVNILVQNAVPEWHGTRKVDDLIDEARRTGKAIASEHGKLVHVTWARHAAASLMISVKAVSEKDEIGAGAEGVPAPPPPKAALNTAPHVAPSAREAPLAAAPPPVLAPALVEIPAPTAARPAASPPGAHSVVPIEAVDDEAQPAMEQVDDAVSAEELNRQGGVLLAQGQQEESIPYFDRAFALDSKLTGALLNKGYALQRLGRLVEAQAAGDKVLELSAAARIRASAQVLLGKIAEGSGQVVQARARYQQALREKSNYPQALEALGALPPADETRKNGQPPSSPPASKGPSQPEHKPTPLLAPSHEGPSSQPRRWVDPFDQQ